MKERIIGTTVSCKKISLESVTFLLPKAGGDGVTDLTMNTLKILVPFQVFELQQKKLNLIFFFESKIFNLYT